MNGYNAMKFFNTEAEAKAFAKEVESASWGWMKDSKTGKIVKWYVEFNYKL